MDRGYVGSFLMHSILTFVKIKVVAEKVRADLRTCFEMVGVVWEAKYSNSKFKGGSNVLRKLGSEHLRSTW